MGNTPGRTIQVYDGSQTPAALQFYESLKDLIAGIFGGVNFENVTTNGISRSLPLLVLCHNYSRIGTDIEHATHALTDVDPSKTAVLVFHMREPHALPMTMPTDNLVDDRYTRYRLMDFAFTNERGIYSCQMNGVGRDKLTRFLEVFIEKPSPLPYIIYLVVNWGRRQYQNHRKVFMFGLPSIVILATLLFWFPWQTDRVAEQILPNKAGDPK